MRTQANINILCLSETFLTDEFSNHELTIQNHYSVRKDRQSHVGDLFKYTKSNLSCSRRDDLESDGIEMLWLEMKNNRQKPFLLCYVYRPPSATNNRTEIVEETLKKASCESKEILVLGDFNFNLLNKTASTDPWMQKTEQLNLFQLVQTPTRVTYSTETLIDLAYSNVPESNRIYDGVEALTGNLRLVFRLCCLMRGLPSIRLK